MNVPVSIIKSGYKDQVLRFYLTAKSLASKNGGYVRIGMFIMGSTTGFSVSSCYFYLAKLQELGLAEKRRPGVWHLRSIRQINWELDGSDYVVVMPEDVLKTLKSFQEWRYAAAGIDFVSWKHWSDLQHFQPAVRKRQTRLVKRNVGQYALSLSTKQLGWSISKASNRRQRNSFVKLEPIETFMGCETQVVLDYIKFNPHHARCIAFDTERRGFYRLDGYIESFKVKFKRGRKFVPKCNLDELSIISESCESLLKWVV